MIREDKQVFLELSFFSNNRRLNSLYNRPRGMCGFAFSVFSFTIMRVKAGPLEYA